MKKVFTGSRIILGLMFFVFGLNFFFQFLPMPPPNEAMRKIFEGIMAMGYLLPVVKTLEFISGALLLAGVFVPLALLLLAPIVVNIAIIHFFYDPSGAPMAALIVVLMLLLAWEHRGKFAPILRSKG